MKHVHTLTLLILLFTTPLSFSSTNNQQKTLKANTKSETTIVKPADLFGQWRCPYKAKGPMPKMGIDVFYDIDFQKNGNSKGVGHLLLTLEGMPSLKYLIKDRASWSLSANTLSVSSNELSFTNVSNPDLDKLLDLQAFFPKQVNDAVTITSLTKSNITFAHKSLPNGLVCSRI